MTAKQEREQIVKYLRETAAMLDELTAQQVTPLKSRFHAESCRLAANAIEIGEHWYDPQATEKGKA